MNRLKMPKAHVNVWEQGHDRSEETNAGPNTALRFDDAITELARAFR